MGAGQHPADGAFSSIKNSIANRESK